MGGTCSTEGKPIAYSVEDLADLPLDGIHETSRGCAPSIEGTQGGSGLDWLQKRGFAWPDNGEFNYAGLGGPCELCSNVGDGYGCECKSAGANAIGGQRGRIKRVAYLADPTQCCIANGAKVISGKTCNPAYRDFSKPDCDTAMINYCNQNRWGSTECRNWVQAVVAANRSTANVPLSNYCSTGSNFNKPECQEWCGLVRNSPFMKSACDAASIAYCKNVAHDPLCTCQQPPANVTKISELMSSSKVCWYKPCQTLGNDNYITSTQVDQKRNCASTACLIEAGDIDISGAGNTVKFDNSCALNIVKPEFKDQVSTTTAEQPTPKPPSQPSQSTQPTKPSNPSMPSFNNNQMISYGSGSLLLLIIIIAVIYFVMNRKN